MALEDDLILRNPFEFQVSVVLVNDSVTREAITVDQMRKFLNFVKEDEHFSRYYEAFYILFHTGMRISEFCGLTVKDLNMKEGKINIDHQLMRWSDMKYGIESPKTNAGTRQIPMTSEVYECFKIILEQRKKYKVEPVIDGYRGFLFWIKTKCRWWHCTGRSIFNTLSKNITVFIKRSFQRSRLMYVDTPTVAIRRVPA